METPAKRILHLHGSPYQAGFQAGQTLGHRLEANIARYQRQRHIKSLSENLVSLQTGALPWLRRLPERFQAELEGMAAGSGLPLQRLAEWVYLEALLASDCSGFFFKNEGNLWVARNNDTFVPEMWGYAVQRAIEGRIPTLTFGMEGDIFTPTGINRERIWLHHQYLPSSERPHPGANAFPGYIWLPVMLESCRSLWEVEQFLTQHELSEGMILFAGDGKTGECAVYECTCTGFRRCKTKGIWLAATNHACLLSSQPDAAPASLARLKTIETRLAELEKYTALQLPGDLIAILADEAVERRGTRFATACANAACLTTAELWYTFGGLPAASQGKWQRLDWPW